ASLPPEEGDHRVVRYCGRLECLPSQCDAWFGDLRLPHRGNLLRSRQLLDLRRFGQHRAQAREGLVEAAIRVGVYIQRGVVPGDQVIANGGDPVGEGKVECLRKIEGIARGVRLFTQLERPRRLDDHHHRHHHHQPQHRGEGEEDLVPHPSAGEPPLQTVHRVASSSSGSFRYSTSRTFNSVTSRSAPGETTASIHPEGSELTTSGGISSTPAVSATMSTT